MQVSQAFVSISDASKIGNGELLQAISQQSFRVQTSGDEF